MSLILFGLYAFFHSLIFWGLSPNESILAWTAFIPIVLSSYQFFKHKKKTLIEHLKWPLGSSALIVMLYGFLQMLSINPLGFSLRNKLPGSFLGYQNFTALFMAVFISFQIVKMSMYKRTSKLTYIILACSFFYLAQLASRAMIMATTIVVFYLLLTNDHKKIVLKKIFLSLLLTSIFFTGFNNIKKTITEIMPKNVLSSEFSEEIYEENIYSDSVIEDKKSSLEIRILRWRNTVDLILENPLGVGISNYSFAYQEYSRRYGKDFETSLSWLPKSPHNGFLHIASELGIFALIAFVFFLSVFYSAFFTLATNKENRDSDYQFIACILIILSVDFFFNFPYDYPWSFFLMAFCLAFVLSFQKEAAVSNRNSIFKLCIILLGISSLYLSFAKFKSNSVFEQSNSYSYEEVCKLLPSSWRVCAKSALLDFDNEKYDLAIEKSISQLQSYPQNVVALRILIQSKIHQRRYRSACDNLRQFKIPSLKEKYQDYYKNLCMKVYHYN